MDIDTDTIGLVLLLIAIAAVWIAGKLQDRRRKPPRRGSGKPADAGSVWRQRMGESAASGGRHGKAARRVRPGGLSLTNAGYWLRSSRSRSTTASIFRC